MLGVSVFLGKELTEETAAYLKTAKENGFEGIFSSVHIPEEDSTNYLERLKTLGEWANALDMELIVDISGKALASLGLSFEHPKGILETGVTGLRIDYGIENGPIADLTNHMKVALNASTITEKDIEDLTSAGADFLQMEAWHNYYPRPETGLGKKEFIAKNQWLKKRGFRIMAFVPGDKELRGPLFQHLPTLEKHRFIHPLAGAIELMQECFVDDVYIGDPQISGRTRMQFEQYFKKSNLVLHVYQQASSAGLDMVVGKHQNRWDAARDVIRSSESRAVNVDKIKPMHPSAKRTIGSVTVDNHLYGRYNGEIQIVLSELPEDKKVNVAAQVIPEDLPLLDFCRSGQLFEIVHDIQQKEDLS